MYGCCGLLEEVVDRRLLDDPGRVHDDDVVGDLGDDAEVVRDHDDRACRSRSWSLCISSRICACVVTSSAVVGSSAISSVGVVDERHRDHHALAHAARELVRVVVDPPLGARDPDRLERLERARACASFFETSLWSRIASTIWSPILCTGFSDVIGSWKIIAMSLPRISRRRVELDACSRSSPLKSASPLARRATSSGSGP